MTPITHPIQQLMKFLADINKTGKENKQYICEKSEGSFCSQMSLLSL